MKTEMTIPCITLNWTPNWARTCLLAIVPALALATGAQAQVPTEGGLARARALFDKVDLDSDGLVSAREAGRHGIPTRDFVAHDTNRDRQLESEEFVIFYRQLRVKAGKRVYPDLEAEAARIQAERRARQAAEARRREAARRTPRPSGGSGPGTTPPTGGDDADRIAAARKQAEDERIRKAREQAEAERIRKAREQSDQAQADAEAERIRKAREQGQETDADRIAAARRQAEADRIRRAREQKQKSDADRIAAARRKQGQSPPQSTPVTTRRKVGLQEVPPGARRRPGNGAGDAPGLTDEQRARSYVKGLVDRGRLTPEQARDFYNLLLAPKAPTSDQDKIAELRGALKRVRQRIGDLVRKGDLTAEEGRQLSAILEARAKAALPDKSGPGKRRLDGDKGSGPDARRVPAGKRTTGKQGGAGKKQVGAQRVGEVRKAKTIKVGGTDKRKDG